MNQIAISPTGEFLLGGMNFVIDVSARNRRPSDAQAFTIVKNEFYLRFYEDLATSFRPRSILELGIFQGGGYVLLDKLFKPDRMSAVELSAEPVTPLVTYCGGIPNRFAHFGTSQSDRDALGRIVRDELAGQLDLIVDDASHDYEATRASFEFLFPLLAPDGIYVIEDWSWAHAPNYQSSDVPFANRPALSNLLFEQISSSRRRSRSRRFASSNRSTSFAKVLLLLRSAVTANETIRSSLFLIRFCAAARRGF